MTGHEHAHQPGWAGAPLLVALALAGLAYLLAVRRLHRTGRPWPVVRTALWLLGLGAAAAGVLIGSGSSFAVHMVGHVLLGMLGPLLLARAAPVTLALRALPAGRAKLLSRVLRSVPVALLTTPVVAALLSVGGLWLLYRTDLHAAAGHDPLLGLAVSTHVLLAGYLFTATLVGPDPVAHRADLGVRAAVLVLAVAAHNVLAKSFAAAPPAGLTEAEALAGGQLMYYLGAPVEIAVFVLLGREWARGDRRRARRSPVPQPGPAGELSR
ncbi:cytochrome c oxidase assembly protein [Pseudonocardia humida]|uniref:Cytochrome c oxidase assembly protein n=1 Tax=Pseudonocardia humida TaxID=2800819 RepID=A0ABT1A4A7_9PSEU|nr:cytochrome c oxidase assembly protein [Pseudonocardia humida]MCO1657842.1 cytochrome c oxidase assembly protein [Pseudonocardia humida]